MPTLNEQRNICRALLLMNGFEDITEKQGFGDSSGVRYRVHLPKHLVGGVLDDFLYVSFQKRWYVGVEWSRHGDHRIDISTNELQHSLGGGIEGIMEFVKPKIINKAYRGMVNAAP